jgi:uncharacterized protein (DUF2164 family)
MDNLTLAILRMWYDTRRSATDSEREQLARILTKARQRIEREVEMSVDETRARQMLTQAIRELRG